MKLYVIHEICEIWDISGRLAAKFFLLTPIVHDWGTRLHVESAAPPEDGALSAKVDKGVAEHPLNPIF